MARLFEQLRLIAASDCAVLIEGETGTGKRLVASEIHRHSDRAERPIRVVECAGVAPAQLELELFGSERGSFTGAPPRRAGEFALAVNGTLVFDEVTALTPELQARVLRAIESSAVLRLGGAQARRVDVRIIALTSEDLPRLCELGRFRRELYLCLSVLRVQVPPLRERLDDLPALLRRLAEEEGCAPALAGDPRLLAWLRGRRWHGNVRELRNIVQRVRLLGVDEVLTEAEAPPARGRLLSGSIQPFRTAREQIVERFEYEYLVYMLREHGGNVASAARAANQPPSWFFRRIRRHGIDVDRFRADDRPRKKAI